MRTEAQFAATYKEAEWFVSHHKKPVWLVPRKDDYAISVIKPLAEHLPVGTTAVLYNERMEIIDRVEN